MRSTTAFATSPHPANRLPTREQLQHLFCLRRDVRRFRTDALPDDAIESLIRSACLAPSVGLSEPWRFVSVDSLAMRNLVQRDFERQNQAAAAGYEGERADRYRQLKLAGLRDAPEQLAIFVDTQVHQGHGLGRATMPETVAYSVVAAIQNLWLAARVRGIGVGWVSIVQPVAIGEILQVPPDWRLIAYLCLGYPEKPDDDTPELQRAGWEMRHSIDSLWSRK